MKNEYKNVNLDEELDILDLDEEENTYNEIDEIDEIEEVEDTGEFVMEEPYVVPVTEEMITEAEQMERLNEYDEAEEAFERVDSVEANEMLEKTGFMSGLLARLRNLDTMDKIILSLGCFVLAMAIVTLGVFTAYQSSEDQMLTFAQSGKNIENIELIGGSGLLAVTDATVAKIDAINKQEEQKEEDSKNESPATSVVVKMNFTSIQKDLKIKFTNKRTGKLIAGIPFEVKVVAPSGKESIWTDDDKDGIIYNKNIAAGTYYLTLQELEGEIYEKYVLDTSVQQTTVKKEIAYVQVDVSDEIKDESEIDASKEDTEIGNTVESALKDTVKWVATNALPAGKDYVAVKKADIVAPTTTSQAMFYDNRYVMMMISQESENPVTISGLNPTAEVTVGESVLLTATASDGSAITWTSSNPDIATVSGGNVTGVAAGSVTITAKNEADTASATCTVTVKERVVVPEIVVIPDKLTAEVEVGKTTSLTATVTGTENQAVTFASSDDTIATVDANGVITGVKEGTVTITVTSQADTQKTASCSVTVKAAATTSEIKLDKTTAEIIVGRDVLLTATTKPATGVSVKWTTSDAAIATVTAGKVTGVKAGTVTITAILVENNTETVKAECVVTVKEAKGLKTKDGKEVYIRQDDKYVIATAEDYALDTTEFYIYTDVFKYQGWQTFDGKTYYYTEDYKKVTGEQVIMGAKYVFDSNGVLTSSTGIMGIDVSKWNGTIDWNQVKASGVNYVIIRCGYRGSSQGSLIEDPKYKANIEGATKAGLKVGVYFFSQAIDEVEAVQEASMVLSLVKNYKITYPIFIDVEASGGRADNISKETRTAVCKAFCQTIQNAGYTPGVYANKVWLTNKIDTSQLGNCKIWLAQYASQPTYTGRYEMWQYKDSGSVPGISGHVDLNLSYLGY